MNILKVGGRFLIVSMSLLACIGCPKPSKQPAVDDPQPGHVYVDPNPPSDNTSRQNQVVEQQPTSVPQQPAPDKKPEKKYDCSGLAVKVDQESWDNGKPKAREEYVIDKEGNEVLHGTATTWWPNGNKKAEQHYDCGFLDGPRKTWYESGGIWSEGDYNLGVGKGIWRMYYSNGNVAQEWTMVQGAWNGFFRQYHDNGVMRQEVEYVSGFAQGLSRTWDDQGNIVNEKYYHNSKREPG